MGWGEMQPVDVDVEHLLAEHRAACAELHQLRTHLRELKPAAASLPDPPTDRSDLVAMGDWVADCLDALDRLVWRSVVRRLVNEVEQLRGAPGS